MSAASGDGWSRARTPRRGAVEFFGGPLDGARQAVQRDDRPLVFAGWPGARIEQIIGRQGELTAATIRIEYRPRQSDLERVDARPLAGIIVRFDYVPDLGK